MKNQEKVYDLIIVGAGPAGISAAIHAKRDKLKVLIFEKNLIGGKLNYCGLISNYPGFKEEERKNLSEIMRSQLINLDFRIEKEEIISIKKEKKIFAVNSKNCIFFSKSVIFATGTISKKNNIKSDEKIENFNNYYSIYENKELLKNKIVAVVGGGYSGCESANYLRKMTKKIYLIHNKKKINVDYHLEQSIIKDKKIEIFFNSEVKEIKNNDNFKLIFIKDKNDEKKEIKVDLIIICAGIESEFKPVENLNIIDELKWVKVNESFQTKVSGLFAAGDVIKKKYRQVTTAVSDGTVAALSAINYLKKEF